MFWPTLVCKITIFAEQSCFYYNADRLTGKDLDTINKDTERDNFMSAPDALCYGLIDQILKK